MQDLPLTCSTGVNESTFSKFYGAQMCKTKMKRRQILKCGTDEKGGNRRKQNNTFILEVKNQKTENQLNISCI
jgi:hypothetical protein